MLDEFAENRKAEERERIAEYLEARAKETRNRGESRGAYELEMAARKIRDGVHHEERE